MSVTSVRSAIERVQREIEALHRQQTDEAANEAAKSKRIGEIKRSITRTTSSSMLTSRQREIQRLEDGIVACQKKRADLTKRVGDKTAKLHKQQQLLYKEQDREQKTLMESLRRRDLDLKATQDRMLRDLIPAGQVAGSSQPTTSQHLDPSYDAFISHASEDKEALARPLAEKLRSLGIAVWYDDFQLTVGDSLRRSIDRGLARSRFGIVILSPAFFEKNWPQYELDGLVAREMQGGKVILPLWHKVSKDEVMRYSPSLADKFALNTATYSIDELAAQLTKVLRPEA